jgi:hypothetical protein
MSIDTLLQIQIAAWVVLVASFPIGSSQNFLIKSVNRLLFYLQVAAAPWWLPVKQANWRQPEGPDTDIKNRWVCKIKDVFIKDSFKDVSLNQWKSVLLVQNFKIDWDMQS